MQHCTQLTIVRQDQVGLSSGLDVCGWGASRSTLSKAEAAHWHPHIPKKVQSHLLLAAFRQPCATLYTIDCCSARPSRFELRFGCVDGVLQGAHEARQKPHIGSLSHRNFADRSVLLEALHNTSTSSAQHHKLLGWFVFCVTAMF